MSVFKCKMCGGTLEIQNGATVAECEFCGTKQTLPRLDDEKRANLYDRANHFRRNNDFDKAAAIYEQILNEDKTDAEAYWSIVLCRYGIEYVEDPLSHRRIPTVNRAQFTSIFDDDNYKSALEYADTYQKLIYEEEAKAINEIQKGILAISQQEEPFDVFICYKETDNNGKRTHDSVLANDLYHQLKEEGFKVFFARITLEDKLGTAYEPYIFAALNSAKVMVVLGTKPEFFNAVWVKNEWSRYLALIKQGQKKMLIPAYKDMDPYDLPTEFSHLQAQDMSKLGFMQDLIRGIKKILGKNKKSAEPVTERVIINNGEHHDTAPILRRAFLFLEDANYDSANEYAEKVLDINPECAEAYIVKLLIDLRLRKPTDLANYHTPIAEQPNYIKAVRFATAEYRETVEGYNNAIVKRLDTERKSELYAKGVELMRSHAYDEAIGYFSRITTYKDSAQKIEECKQLKESERLADIYSRGTGLFNAGQYDAAIQLFATITDYKDSKEKIELCKEKKEIARKDAIYSRAIQRVLATTATDVQIKQSIEELHTISGYRDVDDKIRELDARLEKWYEDKRIADEKARIKAEEERRTRERLAEEKRIKQEKTKKKVKKAAIIGLPSIVVLAIIIVLVVTLLVPTIQFNKADDLFNQGKYEEAMEMYESLDGFSDSEERIIVLNSIKKIDNNDFETAVVDMLSAGVPVKIVYGMEGGDFSGAAYASVMNTQNSGNIALCTFFNTVYAAAPMSDSTDSPEFVYKNADEFSGLQTPGRKGYNFVKWELNAYVYKTGGMFELKLNAVWQKKGYDIAYNLNGGTIVGENPIAYDVEDENFTLINPTKTGYTFLGWTGTDLDTVTLTVMISKGSAGNREYTANWEANQYTITLKANGGTVEPSTVTATYDASYSLPAPERTGYTFEGWFNGSTEFEAGTWTRTNDLELTAKWEIIDYDIDYILNDGTNHSSNPDKYTVEDTITLGEPTKTGYTFLGWTYEGQTTPIKNVVIAKGTIGEKSYTTNWEANTYTLTFNANGGSVSVESQSVVFDESYTLPVPTNEGYTFEGWFNGSTEFVDGIWNKTSSYELTATWEIIKYTIHYNLNEGTNHSSNPNKYTRNDTVTLYEPTRTGYTFLGWTFVGQTMPTKSVTIPVGTIGEKSYTANWAANTYTVTFNENSGVCDTDNMDVIFDDNVTLPMATRTGYTFLGWFNNGQKYDSGVWKTANSITLTANWEANKYTLSFDKNGGVCNTTSQQVTYDQSYTLPTATRTGYTFLGWFSGEVEYVNGVWKETSGVSLKAKWSANTYTITFDENGGVCDIESKDVVFDETYTLPTPTRVGYTFTGWMYNGSVVNAGTWKTANHCTFVASWSANTNTPYTVNHLLQNITDDNYTLDVAQPLTGTSDTSVTPTVKTYTGFTSPASKTVNVSPDGSQVVNYYYTRNSYTVSFVMNGGESISTVSRKYQANLDLPNGERNGYTFGGWFLDKELANEFTGTMPTQNKTVYAWWAEENKPTDFTYSGTTAYTVNSYVGTSTTMWIPTYIGDIPVDTIPASAFASKPELLKVVVPETVTSIGLGAFKGCVSIEDITLPFVGNSVTATHYDAVFGYIFGYSSKVPGLNSSYLTSNYQKSLSNEFVNGNFSTTDGTINQYSCYNYKGTAIEGSYNSAVTRYGLRNYNYYIPISIKNVTITKQTDIPVAAFNNCDFIENIVLSDSVIRIGNYAFCDCSGLVRLNSEVNGEYNAPCEVVVIGDYAFSGCTNIEKITVGSLSSIGKYSFSGCSLLSKFNSNNAGELILPDGLQTIGTYAFENSLLITKVYIPNSVTSIGLKAFNGCVAVEDITMPFIGENRDDSKPFDYIFPGILGVLKKVNITDDITIPDSAFSGCRELIEVQIPENVTSIGSHAFGGCEKLLRFNSDVDGVFNIPKSISVINEHAFSGDSCLEQVTVGKLTSIGNYAFGGCSLLSKFNSSNANELIIPDGTETIGNYAFQDVLLVKKVIIPESVVSIAEGVFKGCNAIEDITLPFVGNSLTATYHDAVFGYIFGQIITGASGHYIDDYAYQSTMSKAFVNILYATTDGSINQYNCYDYKGTANIYSGGSWGAYTRYGLRNYNYYIPTTIKNVMITVQTDIPVAAFNNCDFIETINLPYSVETYGSVGGYAFQNCSATINYNVTPTVSVPWDGTKIATAYNSGDGTVNNPYVIFNGAQFAYFAEQVNSGVTYANTYFVLGSNINLSNYTFPVIGATEETAFAGVLDGNGFTIKNLNVSATGVYNGLFGYCKGTIRNLGLETCSLTITNSENVDVYGGGLVGYLTGTVENCYINAFSSTNTLYKGYVGGLVGYNAGSIKNCYVNGTLTTNYSYTGYLGGFVGYNGSSIENCYANVKTTCNSTNFMAYAGGLVGYNNGTVKKCVAYGNVTAKGSAESYSRNGGLIAYVGESSVVENCYRSDAQVLTKYTTVGNSYCNEGTVATNEEILSFCQSNWDSSIWDCTTSMPVLK